MKPSSLNTAVGVLFAVATTAPGVSAAGIKHFGRRAHQNIARGHRHHIVAPDTNSTTSSASLLTTTCALEIVTSTITVDVTTTVEPCTDSITTVKPTITLTLSTTSSTSSPCTDDITPTATADATVTSATSTTTTEPCDESTSSSISVTGFLSTTTSSSAATTTAYPIDTSITPIVTAAPTITTTEVVTNTLPPTTTVCETSAPTGTPAPRAVHCGVHGLPVGNFFLGRYVEERAGVPVSLEGCWAFCKTAWGATNGCQSYDYYVNELGAPRCDLYSSRVAFALDTVDNRQPNLWFDLECGNPTDPKWTHSHPHTARAVTPHRPAIRGGRRA